MTFRNYLSKTVAVFTALCGGGLAVFSLLLSLLMGGYLQESFRESPLPRVVSPHEAPTDAHLGKLLELHGTLRSGDVLRLPEYGIHLPATCLLVEVRELAPDADHPERSVLYPLSAEHQKQLGCPNRQLWAEKLHCGAYPIAPDFIPSLLKQRSRTGHIAERCILPLPAEHIHLPEHLQSMARLLPETQRLDRPDCTILRLAERYRNPDTPTETTQHGDIELRFSYLPAEIPIALRGKMGESYITYTTDAAFAAGDRLLPQSESPSPLSHFLATCGVLFLPAVVCMVLLLSGMALLKLGVCCLMGRAYHFPHRRMLALTLSLQGLAMLAGCLL